MKAIALLTVRVSPQIKRYLELLAAHQGKSINTVAKDALEHYFGFQATMLEKLEEKTLQKE